MPTYLYRCSSCQTSFERVLPLKDYRVEQSCPCGGVGEKMIVAPAVKADYPPYTCPVTGKLVEGRRAHEENLKRTGCRVLEIGEREDSARAQLRAEQEFDRKIEATAEEFISGLPAVKKERLAGEMTAGVTATVVRQ